jgi:hypothetical protein
LKHLKSNKNKEIITAKPQEWDQKSAIKAKNRWNKGTKAM